MNIIKMLTARIEDRRTETKNPCKNYDSEAAAEKATADMAREVADYLGCDAPAHYVVFYIEDFYRWVGCINLTECMNRKESKGGYIGICADKGFFSW